MAGIMRRSFTCMPGLPDKFRQAGTLLPRAGQETPPQAMPRESVILQLRILEALDAIANHHHGDKLLHQWILARLQIHTLEPRLPCQ